MTEEEWDNLKVGDVVKYRNKSIERIDGIVSEDYLNTTVIVNLRPIGKSNYQCTLNKSMYRDCTHLPLYNSPLYKAMQEDEEKA